MRILLLVALLAMPLIAQEAGEVTFAASEAFVPAPQLGEAVGGFPNWSERVIHQWMNRARCDPQAELKSCPACPDAPCYSPEPPLGWNESLSRAARFHADEMRTQGYFAHDSRCVIVPNIAALYPSVCDGSAACACKSAGATSWQARVGLFGAGANGEIIASGSNPNSAFYLWLFEPAQSSSCQFGANGHRLLILKSQGAVGVGMSTSAVGDFGGGPVPLKIASAAHYPRQADTVELWANWYDFAGPRSASVVVDGRCVPMTLRRGSPQNGAWVATVSGVGAGCHRYYLNFTDASGAVFTYPSTGSLGIGSGSSCPDWDGSRSAASCGSVTSGRRRLTRRN